MYVSRSNPGHICEIFVSQLSQLIRCGRFSRSTYPVQLFSYFNPVQFEVRTLQVHFLEQRCEKSRRFPMLYTYTQSVATTELSLDGFFQLLYFAGALGGPRACDVLETTD